MRALTSVPVASFIGRRDVLASVHASFAGGERLITLIGPPGIGKTRLAATYAEMRAASYPGGAWLSDLTAAHDIVQANAVICATLGVETAGRFDGARGSETLGDALAGRGSMLLILDNFEQLVPDAGPWVARWCAQAPELRVLVTSRERLRVTGELAIELGPLTVPARDAAVREVGESEAVRLFQDRARVAAGIDHAVEDLAAIGALVGALDGIPLAIELAAARARTLTPIDMLERLKRRFEVLRSRGRPDDDRHATLERAIDWSWTLLQPREQVALAQCSVFAGGFSLDAAERVLALDPGGPPVHEVLEALCDKSLVRARAEGGTVRFSMYVSIHDYAAAKLVDREAVVARHAAYYLAAAETWSLAVNDRADAPSRARLLSAQENVMAVYERAVAASHEPGRAAEAVRAALAVYPVLENHGPRDELLRMVDDAVRLSEEPGVSANLRARALFARGNAYGDRGKLRESISDLELALSVAESAGDALVHGEALSWLSVRYRHAGRFASALAMSDRAEELLGGTPHLRALGLALAVRGRMRGEVGQTAASRQDNERAMAIFRELGDRWFLGLTLANLGQLDMESGGKDSARWYYEQSLEAFREVKDARFEGRYLGYLGCLDWDTGDRVTAASRIAEAVKILETSRALNYAPLFRGILGALHAEMGELDAARSHFDRAESALSGSGIPAYVAAVNVHRGQLDLARARLADERGDREEAARLREEARARLLGKRSAAPSGDPKDWTLLDCSDDVRFAVRMLERALASAHPPTGAPLVLGRDARWFSLDGHRVDLTRRGPMRLLLDALCRHHVEHPGRALRHEALLAAGWPGEKVLTEAGGTRVRVAVSTLRRLGLEGVLVTRDDGYLIDPTREVRHEPG